MRSTTFDFTASGDTCVHECSLSPVAERAHHIFTARLLSRGKSETAGPRPPNLTCPAPLRYPESFAVEARRLSVAWAGIPMELRKPGSKGADCFSAETGVESPFLPVGEPG
jgi:hypothetical protein